MRRAVLSLLCIFSLSGCAAAALTAGGIAGAAGVDHTLNGIAYKTFNEPINGVRLATLKGLDRLAMKVAKDEETKEGWKIEATASQREISIELEKLTDRATRMRVVTNHGDIFFKDSATSTEIILQTANAIDERRPRTAPVRQAAQ